MIQLSKDERKLLWVQYMVIKPYRIFNKRIYMNAPEEYIILFYLKSNLKILLHYILISLNDQKDLRYNTWP